MELKKFSDFNNNEQNINEGLFDVLKNKFKSAINKFFIRDLDIIAKRADDMKKNKEENFNTGTLKPGETFYMLLNVAGEDYQVMLTMVDKFGNAEIICSIACNDPKFYIETLKPLKVGGVNLTNFAKEGSICTILPIGTLTKDTKELKMRFFIRGYMQDISYLGYTK